MIIFFRIEHFFRMVIFLSSRARCLAARLAPAANWELWPWPGPFGRGAMLDFDFRDSKILENSKNQYFLKNHSKK